MKIIFIITVSFLLASVSCRSSKPAAETKPDANAPVAAVGEPLHKAADYSDPETWILGYFKIDRLYQDPHSGWFVNGFDKYSFNQDAVNSLKKIIDKNISIKIVLGTWCPDSRREVPKFFRVLKEIGFPREKVQLIGVDNSKIAPVDNYEALNILRVPTFMIFKNNIETGRIIENPTTSLEQDMVNILTRNE